MKYTALLALLVLFMITHNTANAEGLIEINLTMG